MSDVKAGLSFAVREICELRKEDGSLLARYHPELSPYRVTVINAVFVSELIAQGKAYVAGAGPRRPAGVVTVSEN